MEFALIGIYTNELLPTRARSIGGGMMSVFGTVGSTICPIIMGLLTRNNINPFILFTILGIFGTSSYTFLKETYQQPIPDEIEEIEYEKQQKRSIKQNSHSKAKLK
jgi:MFS family permease